MVNLFVQPLIIIITFDITCIYLSVSQCFLHLSVCLSVYMLCLPCFEDVLDERDESLGNKKGH